MKRCVANFTLFTRCLYPFQRLLCRCSLLPEKVVRESCLLFLCFVRPPLGCSSLITLACTMLKTNMRVACFGLSGVLEEEGKLVSPRQKQCGRMYDVHVRAEINLLWLLFINFLTNTTYNVDELEHVFPVFATGMPVASSASPDR